MAAKNQTENLANLFAGASGADDSGNESDNLNAPQEPGEGPAVPNPSPSPDKGGNGAQRQDRGRTGGAGSKRGGGSGNSTQSSRPRNGQNSPSYEPAPATEREQEHLLKRWGAQLNRDGLAVRAAERQLDERHDAWEVNVRSFRREAVAAGVPEELVERVVLKASLEANGLGIPAP